MKIKSSINIHDKYSVVIESNFDKLLKRNSSEYTCITYLFFPDSLNINNKTFPGSKFYNNVRVFIKYNLPHQKLSEIYSGPNSPLKKLEKSTRNFIEKNSVTGESHFEEQVKMFASTFSILLTEQTDKIVHSADLNRSTIENLLNIQWEK